MLLLVSRQLSRSVVYFVNSIACFKSYDVEKSLPKTSFINISSLFLNCDHFSYWDISMTVQRINVQCIVYIVCLSVFKCFTDFRKTTILSGLGWSFCRHSFCSWFSLKLRELNQIFGIRQFNSIQFNSKSNCAERLE